MTKEVLVSAVEELNPSSPASPARLARIPDPATNALILILVIPKPFWPKK